LRDWRAKFISVIIAIAIWAVIKPLVEEKKPAPGSSPGGGSANAVPERPTADLAQNR